MMPLSLIGKIGANNTKGDGEYPFTDATSKIVFDSDDGNDPVSFKVNSANPLHVNSRDEMLTEFNGSYKAARQLTWTVTFTDKRILFWAPETVGPFGGVKPGGGSAATLGHMKYALITGVSVGNDPNYAGNMDGFPEICIESWKQESHISSTKCFIEADTRTLGAILMEFAKRYIAYGKRRGNMKQETEGNLLKFAGFQWESGKGLAQLDLGVSPAVVETTGTLQFNDISPEAPAATPQEKAEPSHGESAVQNKAFFCKNCGHNLQGASDSAKFCPKCGTEFMRRGGKHNASI